MLRRRTSQIVEPRQRGPSKNNNEYLADVLRRSTILILLQYEILNTWYCSKYFVRSATHETSRAKYYGPSLDDLGIRLRTIPPGGMMPPFDQLVILLLFVAFLALLIGEWENS